MALAINLGPFASRPLEMSTISGASHLGIGDNSEALDQQEPIDVNPSHLPEPHVVHRWPQLPTPGYPPTQRDWDNYRNIFTELYQVEDRPLKTVKEVLKQHYGFKAT
jgi:hypothetical protein